MLRGCKLQGFFFGQKTWVKKEYHKNDCFGFGMGSGGSTLEFFVLGLKTN